MSSDEVVRRSIEAAVLCSNSPFHLSIPGLTGMGYSIRATLIGVTHEEDIRLTGPP